jgi:hypothetical protein
MGGTDEWKAVDAAVRDGAAVESDKAMEENGCQFSYSSVPELIHIMHLVIRLLNR